MRTFAWTVILLIASGIALVGIGFMLEKLFLEESEWWHWGLLSLPFWIVATFAAWKLHCPQPATKGADVRRRAREAAAPPSGVGSEKSAIDDDAIKGLISSIAILGILGGGVYGLILVDWGNPNEIWGHPTLSADEQERVKAECRMRAQEAIQGGGIKDGARSLYAKDCLISEGFQRVLDDN